MNVLCISAVKFPTLQNYEIFLIIYLRIYSPSFQVFKKIILSQILLLKFNRLAKSGKTLTDFFVIKSTIVVIIHHKYYYPKVISHYIYLVSVSIWKWILYSYSFHWKDNHCSIVHICLRCAGNSGPEFIFSYQMFFETKKMRRIKNRINLFLRTNVQRKNANGQKIGDLEFFW